MPRAYSIDLRERVLAACEAGEGSQARIAERYRGGGGPLSGRGQGGARGGGRPAGGRSAARGGARRAPKPLGGGPKPVGGEAATLTALVAERNDATLAEYADLLAERAGVRRSPSALCRALKALGLVRKKKRSRPPSGIARTWPRRGGPGAPSWRGSPPPASSSSTRPASTLA